MSGEAMWTTAAGQEYGMKELRIVVSDEEWAELELREGQHLVILLPENGVELEPFVEDNDVRQCRAEQAGKHVPSLEHVRQMLSKIPGSMAHVVIAEGDERF
jgi:hypothetical protein